MCLYMNPLFYLPEPKGRLQTSEFSMTSFHMTSFICQVHVPTCNIFYMTSFHDKFYFTGVNVSTSLL